MTSKKSIEIILQNLIVNEKPVNALEQYQTDGKTASYILNIALLDDSIIGKSIIDLGSGNGIFALGAKLLGAKEVTAVDIDSEQMNVLEENARNLELDVKTIVSDVSDVTGKFDTCIMNPPFGSVKTHADLPFIQVGSKISDRIYALHNYKSKDFILKQYSQSNFSRIAWEKKRITTGRIYPHHSRDVAFIDCLFARCIR